MAVGPQLRRALRSFVGSRDGLGRSRVFLLCAILSWVAWLVAVPAGWTGCDFEINARLKNPIKIVVADDVDLSKVEVVYVKVTSPKQAQFEVPKPAGGWPKVVNASTDVAGILELTVTAYDAKFQLMALGESHDTPSGTEVVVQATIPWS